MEVWNRQMQWIVADTLNWEISYAGRLCLDRLKLYIFDLSILVLYAVWYPIKSLLIKG